MLSHRARLSSSGVWESATNWSCGNIPNASNVATIPAGDSVTISSTQTVSGVDILGTLSCNSCTLNSGLPTLSGTLNNNGGTINTQGGGLEPSGTINNGPRGTINTAGGGIINSGIINNGPTSTINLDGGGIINNSGATFTNGSGSTISTSGGGIVNDGTFNNCAGGIISTDGGGQFGITQTGSCLLAPPIPEYPLGLPILAIFMIIGYGVIKRRTVTKQK
jgi:hypothetical protein